MRLLTSILFAFACLSAVAASAEPVPCVTEAECAAGEVCAGGFCCLPACEGKKCNEDDGCGQLCGGCPEGQVCDPSGACCTPDCDEKKCTEDNGCGQLCGCPEGKSCCEDGQCKDSCCVPQCEGKVCGDPDGCGSVCLACDTGKVCINSVCVWDSPVKKCKGPQQPSGDGCGYVGFHGCCDVYGRVVWCAGGKLYCDDCPKGQTQCGWNAEAAWYACGATADAEPSGQYPQSCVPCEPACADGTVCKAGACVEASCKDHCGGEAPAECWCDEQCVAFGDCCQDVCDACKELAQCGGTCVPACEGKECGADGCGGECGECGSQEQCMDGVCVPKQACEDECAGGSAGCDGQGSRWTCVIAADGCFGKQVEPCGPGMACDPVTFACVAVEPVPDAVQPEVADVPEPAADIVTGDVVPEPDEAVSGAGGGCTVRPAGPVPTAAAVLLLACLLAGLGIGWKRKL